MARCELTGKGPVVANLVSHSKIRTKTTSHANVQKRRLYSQSLNEMVTLKVAVSTLRSMEHLGGFDQFILSRKEKDLSKRALEVRGRIRRRLQGAAGKLKKESARA